MEKGSETDAPMTLNLALQGTATKVAALVGALDALETIGKKHGDRRGYKLNLANNRVVGISGGAMVAALLGAGYAISEIREIVSSADMHRFADNAGIYHTPYVGPILGLVRHGGAYQGDYLLQFIRSLLRAKRVRTFGDLVIHDKSLELAYKVHIVALDLTRARMIFLPYDVLPREHGLEADDLEVALAVRMSMSVPFYFRPRYLSGRNRLDCWIVDGGFLNYFPVDFFDTDWEHGRFPLTLGVRVTRNPSRSTPVSGLGSMLNATLSALVEPRNDSPSLDQSNGFRRVVVRTRPDSLFDLGLSQFEKDALYSDGYGAMSDFVYSNGLVKLKEDGERRTAGKF